MLSKRIQSPIASQNSSSSAICSLSNVQRPQLSTKTHHNNRQKRISEFNSNLNLMVFLMVIAVVVCWLPFHVLNLSWAYGLRVTWVFKFLGTNWFKSFLEQVFANSCNAQQDFWLGFIPLSIACFIRSWGRNFEKSCVILSKKCALFETQEAQKAIRIFSGTESKIAILHVLVFDHRWILEDLPHREVFCK